MNLKKNLPVLDFRKKTGEKLPFEIISFAKLEGRQQGWPSADPHRHSFYEILYFIEGKGKHVIDFKSYKIKPFTFYFISPGQVHYWSLQPPFSGFAILFTEEFFIYNPSNQSTINELSFFHSINESCELQLEHEQISPISKLLQSIEGEYKEDLFCRGSVLHAYLHILLIQLQRYYNIKNPEITLNNKNFLLARRFKRLVSEYSGMDHNIQSYAARLGVSAAHLSDIVKNVTGLTPGNIIRNEITTCAKRLLAHTDMNIAEIGYKLNFEDPSYFGRFFKREVEVSPKKFREFIREKYQITPK